jgi:hypothetical protein
MFGWASCAEFELDKNEKIFKIGSMTAIRKNVKLSVLSGTVLANMSRNYNGTEYKYII